MRADVGDVLQGKLDRYEIDEVLVQGRFGATFCARRESDKEDVVLKTIAMAKKADWNTIEAFERESERLRKLSHPHIAPYRDAVVIQREDHTVLGLVQDYVTLPSLREWRDGRGFLDIEQHLGWFEQALATLVYLHELSPPLVHGDIDSGNLLLDDQGELHLVDFATVRQALLDAPTLASGLAIGSLDYAPMEQLLGKIFPSSDLYALAMTFLAIVSKSEPREFPLDGMRPDLEQLLPFGVQPALRELLFQMTEPDPSHRLASARIALERLRAIRHGTPVTDPRLADAASSRQERVARAPVSDPSQRDIKKRDQLVHELIHELSPLFEQGEDFPRWQRDSTPDYERVHAFGIARDGAHMVLAHGHEALILGTQKLETRGEAEFSELARRVSVSRDGKRIAILTGFEELLFFEVDVSVWQRHQVIVEGMWPGNSQLTFGPNGDLVAISDDDQVNLYRWSDGQLVRKWPIDGQLALEFSPDASTLFASGAAGTHILPIDGEVHAIQAHAVAFSPDGTLAASLRDGLLEIGKFKGVTPTLTWQHDARTIKLPAPAKGARWHLLRFSPDQRFLFIGAALGGWKMLDVARGELLDFEDQSRAARQDQVKILEVGYAPDSRRLLMHATLPPDRFSGDPLGAVFGWSLPEGRFLGALLWLDDRPGVMSAPGFFGQLSDLGSRGFSSDVWERPELAGAIFGGKDVLSLLSAQERLSYREFLVRHGALEQILAHSPHPFELADAVDALAPVSHIAPLVFQQADLNYRESLDDVSSLTRGNYTEALEDAAFHLHLEHDEAELLALHRELMLAGAPVTSADAPEKQAPSREAEVSDGVETKKESKRSATAPRQEVRPRSAPVTQRTMTPAVTREAAPEPVVNVSEGRAPDGPPDVFRIVLSLGVGYALVFAYLMLQDGAVSQLSPVLFWTLLLLAGPSLSLVAYQVMFRRRG